MRNNQGRYQMACEHIRLLKQLYMRQLPWGRFTEVYGLNDQYLPDWINDRPARHRIVRATIIEVGEKIAASRSEVIRELGLPKIPARFKPVKPTRT